MTTQNFFHFIAVLGSGLMAGLFYSYSCSVNPGLKALADQEYIKAMQSINSAIQNPLFFVAFMGLLVVFPIAVSLAGRQGMNPSFYYLLFAGVIYFVGVFGVTAFCNVPLNEQLAVFPVATARAADIAAMRLSFEKPWNAYHSVRTVAAVVSFGLAVLSLIKDKHP